MGNQVLHFSCILLVVVGLHCLRSHHGVEASDSRQIYVVYLGEKQHDDPDLVTEQHHDMLTALLGSKEAALDSIVYSYRHGFSGFAANLSESEANQISEYPGVVSVTPNRARKIATTRSWDLLGVPYHQPSGLLEKANYGEDIIVGVVDTGIWPESRSFRDDGYSPVPSRWRGVCAAGEQFSASNCNRKLIGAQWFGRAALPEDLRDDYLSPRDNNTHGTHTASTVAGGAVPGASFRGFARGTARGAVPRARLAVYKACWGPVGHCQDADVLKALDHAVHDGVDVLSLSIVGDGYPHGSLAAALRGITVVFCAGNDGPVPQTVSNVLPWTVSVAATTIDRIFPTAVVLGDNTSVVGYSLFDDHTKANKFKELVHVGSSEDLERAEVSGKMVLYYAPREVASRGNMADIQDAFERLQSSGAVGVILAQGATDILEWVADGNIPCVLIDLALGSQVQSYIYSTRKAVAKIMLSKEAIGSDIASPKVAKFSSRGPNLEFPALLAPDIAAPGACVLAAIKDEYKFDTGTSMACPHVAGVAALLKSIHPDWSPAAIKSAIVTTGTLTNKLGVKMTAEGLPRKAADPFDYGGGVVNPTRAADPGLIYDMTKDDYKKAEVIDTDLFYTLNLPSLAVPDLRGPVSVERTVTHVAAAAAAVYRAVIEVPEGVRMFVEPPVLVFDAKHRRRTFRVCIAPSRRAQGYYVFGSLTWKSDGGSHSVRMPIAIRPRIEEKYADIA